MVHIPAQRTPLQQAAQNLVRAADQFRTLHNAGRATEADADQVKEARKAFDEAQRAGRRAAA